MLILGYSFRIYSAIGVLIVIGGVTLTSLYKAEHVGNTTVIHETVKGIILAILAAVLGGLFGSLFKKWVIREKNSGIVFGLFSIVATIVGIPTIIICHYSGLQEFQIPSWQAALWFVGDAILCSVVGNFFFAQAYIYLTPVAVQVGLTMTIPVSFLITAVFLKSHAYPAGAIVGAVLIFSAIILVSWDQFRYDRLTKEGSNKLGDIEAE
jgi:solute carrier family 35 protein F5